MNRLIEKLQEKQWLEKDELLFLLDNMDEKAQKFLMKKAHQTRMEQYGDSVYMRGLIEFTNYCKRNCLYCGIRSSNEKAQRYRLTTENILECCQIGYNLGYKTFVLQGGEDPYYTDEKIVDIIEVVKAKFPHCAITLSIGEKGYESYKKYYDAGADRYLLRYETASKELYENLHPKMKLEDRIKCLKYIKEIGYQVGTGFLVGLPGQTNADYVEDLVLLKGMQPHMVGIGPFISHKDTPLKDCENGTMLMTTILLGIIRLMLPDALLPATTALGSIDPLGREKGIQFGANVVMPNLSPTNVREKYALYDGKICTADEAAECRKCIEGRINNIGFSVNMSRGDHSKWRGRQ